MRKTDLNNVALELCDGDYCCCCCFFHVLLFGNSTETWIWIQKQQKSKKIHVVSFVHSFQADFKHRETRASWLHRIEQVAYHQSHYDYILMLLLTFYASALNDFSISISWYILFNAQLDWIMCIYFIIRLTILWPIQFIQPILISLSRVYAQRVYVSFFALLFWNHIQCIYSQLCIDNSKSDASILSLSTAHKKREHRSNWTHTFVCHT